MAVSKAVLLKEAQAMGLKVTEKDTVAQINAAIAAMSQTPIEPVEAGDLTVAEEGEAIQAVEDASEVRIAKAGKRSVKGLEEAEAKAEKLEHQKHRDEEDAAVAEKPKRAVTPTRSRLERRSKGYRKAAEQIEKDKVYALAEALELVTKTSSVKFDASVELHINLGVDPRQADQNIRASLVLPQGTGKIVRVAVFADDKIDGADVSGVEAITKQLEKGEISFDTLISTPANMAKLGKYARMLGPRGLMPNPKSGTVTNDLTKAVSEAKAGRIEYRVDSTGIIHLSVGKVSFGGKRLLENTSAVITSIKNAKPTSVKGNYIKAVHITTTMGPSIKVSATE
jgi:large subunit ribosomal protein L1